jgi:hypothetical protein
MFAVSLLGCVCLLNTNNTKFYLFNAKNLQIKKNI